MVDTMQRVHLHNLRTKTSSSLSRKCCRAHYRYTLPAITVLVLLALGCAARAADSPKPTLTVALEKTELLAGKSIGLRLWVENPTDTALTEIGLRFFAPDFIEIGRLDQTKPGSCDTSLQQPIILRASSGLGAKSAFDPPEAFCLKAKDTIEEQDVNVVFSIVYRLAGSKQPETGVAVVERKLSVGLFGTDTVAGVSLRLAAYIVPGLLLMLVLKLAKVPWLVDLDAAELGTFSVLISVALSLGAAQLAEVGWLSGLFFGAASGVSAKLFLVLCSITLLLALAIAGVFAAIRRYRRLRTVDAGDEDVDILTKALRSTWNPLPTIVVARNQMRYIGSLSARTADGGVALVGWFELDPPAGSELRQNLERLLAQRAFLQALELAQKNHLDPARANGIRRSEAGNLRPTDEGVHVFQPAEHPRVSRGAVPGLGIEPAPLILTQA